ncbi:PEP-CTERM sorting domain-containing protein [Haloferula sp.]|uniref:PEP-CTERM sorting domain-containing protein n=1 Tax=Haloferula sp. TaxID=2497595 RepID=UPI00329D7CDC
MKPSIPNRAAPQRLIVQALLTGAFATSSCLASSIVWYDQDYESLASADSGTDGGALADVGWNVGATVTDSGGGFIYNYFTFPAPNGGAGFSAVSVHGVPTVAQGSQGMVVYNDYNNGDHFNASGNIIEALVFQEQTLGIGNDGTFTFQWDAIQDNLEAPTEAFAFVKVLNPATGFSTTFYDEFDTTATGTTWETNSLSVAIDPGLSGQLLQFGFGSRASGGTASGVNYDNVSLIPEPSTALLGLLGLGFLARRRR